MNIETNLLPQLSLDMITCLKEMCYSPHTLERYQITHNQFFLYLKEHNHLQFNEEIGFQFIDEHYRTELKEVNDRYFKCLRRRICVLFEFYKEGTISNKRIEKPTYQLASLQWVFDVYVTTQEKRKLALKTMKHKSEAMKCFLNYLENQGFSSLENLTATTIYQYLQTKRDYAISSREGVLYILRDALQLFSAHGLCKPELGKLFPQISTHAEDSVPSCYSPEELKRILSAVDRNTKIGKRDYAVLLLASFLGMRAGDIRELKISSFKWFSDSIEFTQSKTGRYLQLPLLSEVKFAILDYLKNGRPEIDSDFVFLRHSAPHNPLDQHNSLYHVLQKYLGNINLKSRKHGLHSLRFTAAGNMLSNGTPITTICNVLGHTYSDTTKHYLKIDLDSLRKAALEVELA